jgi:gluconolactonase
MHELARGLDSPAAPMALDDGSILVAEVGARTLTRVGPDGEVDRLIDCGGAPRGAALGPCGRIYICTSIDSRRGAIDANGAHGRAAAGAGRIQVADLERGSVEELYVACGDVALSAPNAIVFDGDGGFYFTDHGQPSGDHARPGGLYYARSDGSEIVEVAFPLEGGPNGIALSPDRRQVIASQTRRARILSWDISRPSSDRPCFLLGTVAGEVSLESLAMERDGRIAIATALDGGPSSSGITVLSADGEFVEFVEVPTAGVITNICFGGPDMRTAYITALTHGAVYITDWPRPGLPLVYQALGTP